MALIFMIKGNIALTAYFTSFPPFSSSWKYTQQKWAIQPTSSMPTVMPIETNSIRSHSAHIVLHLSYPSTRLNIF